MNIRNAVFDSLDNSSIKVEFDGKLMGVPVDPANRHYAEIVEQEIEIAPYVEPEPSWIDSRIAAYGSWGEQMDMQYWDGLNDTTVWPDHIAQVKADHPKPS